MKRTLFIDATNTSLVAQRSILMEFCQDPGAEVVVRIWVVVRQRRRKAHDLVSFKITHSCTFGILGTPICLFGDSGH